MKHYLLITIISLSNNLLAVDSLKIHFIYGSKPAKGYENIQNKWFGGVHGGHVGISTNEDSIFHFLPNGELHLRKHCDSFNSKFIMSSSNDFKYIFGKETDSIKMLSISIPINAKDKITIDSLHQSYIKSSPYDYAFIGMRCAAASYEVLSHIGITKNKQLGKVVLKNFYPKPLRKRLLKKAKRKGWSIKRQPGSIMRIWEKD